jgi:enoyl-CoA hydratase/carnithine racemase
MSGFAAVIYEKDRGIAYVTLNRPQALNSFSVQMRDDLYEVLNAIRADEDVLTVIIKGAGEKAFCAGADLTEFLTAPPPVKARQVRLERDLWDLFLRVPQPLIAAVHGYVLGSGIEIAAFCDIRIAADNAVFGLPEVGLGIIPAAGGTQTIPRAIGLSHSLHMLLTNRWIRSDEAFRIGLVNRIVPKGEHVKVAEAVAQKIASHSPDAVKRAKQAILRGVDLPLHEGLEMERRLVL